MHKLIKDISFLVFVVVLCVYGVIAVAGVAIVMVAALGIDAIFTGKMFARSNRTTANFPDDDDGLGSASAERPPATLPSPATESPEVASRQPPAARMSSSPPLV